MKMWSRACLFLLMFAAKFALAVAPNANNQEVLFKDLALLGTVVDEGAGSFSGNLIRWYDVLEGGSTDLTARVVEPSKGKFITNVNNTTLQVNAGETLVVEFDFTENDAINAAEVDLAELTEVNVESRIKIKGIDADTPLIINDDEINQISFTRETASSEPYITIAHPNDDSNVFLRALNNAGVDTPENANAVVLDMNLASSFQLTFSNESATTQTFDFSESDFEQGAEKYYKPLMFLDPVRYLAGVSYKGWAPSEVGASLLVKRAEHSERISQVSGITRPFTEASDPLVQVFTVNTKQASNDEDLSVNSNGHFSFPLSPVNYNITSGSALINQLVTDEENRLTILELSNAFNILATPPIKPSLNIEMGDSENPLFMGSVIEDVLFIPQEGNVRIDISGPNSFAAQHQAVIGLDGNWQVQLNEAFSDPGDYSVVAVSINYAGIESQIVQGNFTVEDVIEVKFTNSDYIAISQYTLKENELFSSKYANKIYATGTPGSNITISNSVNDETMSKNVSGAGRWNRVQGRFDIDHWPDGKHSMTIINHNGEDIAHPNYEEHGTATIPFYIDSTLTNPDFDDSTIVTNKADIDITGSMAFESYLANPTAADNLVTTTLTRRSDSQTINITPVGDPNNGSLSWTANIALSGSEAVVYDLVSTDYVGNVSETISLSVTLDQTINKPQFSDLSKGQTFNRTNDTDGDSRTFSTTNLLNDETATITFTHTDNTSYSKTAVTAGNVSFTLTQGELDANLEDGEYTVTLSSVDEAGNKYPNTEDSDPNNNEADATQFTIDRVNNELAITSAVVAGNKITVTGTKEKDATVSFVNVDYTDTDSSTGTSFTITTPALKDGSYDLKITSVDAAGNTYLNNGNEFETAESKTVSAFSGVVAQTINATTIETTNYFSPVAQSEFIVAGTAQVSGIDNVDVTIVINSGSSISSATVVRDGSGWSANIFDIVLGLADGLQHTIDITATDTLGNESTTSFTVNIDKSVAAPTVDGYSLPISNLSTGLVISGTFERESGPGQYSDLFLTVGGLAEQQLYAGESNTIASRTTIDVSGNWTYTIPANKDLDFPLGHKNLLTGTHQVVAKTVDQSGNNETNAVSSSFEVDKTVAMPVISGVVALTKEDSQSINIDVVEAGDLSVKIFGPSGFTDIDKIVTITSVFTHPEALAGLPDGSYQIETSFTDSFGNSSTTVSDNFVIDSDVKNPTFDGADLTPKVTGLTFTLNGTAELDAAKEAGGAVQKTELTIKGFANGGGDFKTIVNVSGSEVTPRMANWSKLITIPESGRADRNYAIELRTTDTAGNESLIVSETLVIDTKNTLLTLASINSPRNTQPSIGGMAENDATVFVTITGEGSTYAFQGIDPVVGQWALNLSSELLSGGDGPGSLADGSYVVAVTSIDESGNPNETLLPSVSITIDTQMNMPEVFGVTTNFKSPNPLVITGKADADSTLTISIEGPVNREVLEHPVQASRNWSYVLPTDLPDGEYKVYVKSTDLAGNFKPLTDRNLASADLVIDTTVVDYELTTLSSPDPMPTFSGIIEAGATIDSFTLAAISDWADVTGVTFSSVTYEPEIDGKQVWQISMTAGNLITDPGQLVTQYGITVRGSDVIGNQLEGDIVPPNLEPNAFKYHVYQVALNDADSDGISDSIEGRGATIATSVNTDGDQFPEGHEFAGQPMPDYLDEDSDNDGILDKFEYSVSDGFNNNFDEASELPGPTVLNFRDLDSDGDGILDSVELNVDSSLDDDNDPNYLDLDSDGDEINDAVEGVSDIDGDSFGNYLDADSDGDDLLDSAEGVVDTDGDGKADYVDTDSDNDLVPDIVESKLAEQDIDDDGKVNHLDRDSDGDGLPDIVESGYTAEDGLLDSDKDTGGLNDNLVDMLDTDSDNDGIPDVIESKLLAGDDDTDGIANSFDVNHPSNDGKIDANGDSIIDEYTLVNTDGVDVPNYLDTDSDNDGISDLVESGVTLDTFGDLLDTDGDGVNDYFDIDSVINDGLRDENSDSIADGKLALESDLDSDLIENYLDTDSDDDGLLDEVELVGSNVDGDNAPNYIDLDSDNDGFLDNEEGLANFDGDGFADREDKDSDNDGIPDALETITSRIDIDSDDDGIPDSVEAQIPGMADSDGDGIIDYYDALDGVDATVDIDGVKDDAALPESSLDSDLVADYLDTDSDGDNILDTDELTGDVDVDLAPNYIDLDSDNDGLLDSVELAQNTLLGTPLDRVNVDSDGDKIPDAIEAQYSGLLINSDDDSLYNHQDPDSDNDGLSDQFEMGVLNIEDTDNDGIINMFDAVPDGMNASVDADGVIDDFVAPESDLDSDNIANYLDPDSDGDGLNDGEESFGDVDQDGAMNFLDLDSDNDSLLDSVELRTNTLADTAIDRLNADSDGDGVPDAIEAFYANVLLDSDNDGLFNYQDTDSDNDGLADALEVGVPEGGQTIDADSDGVIDFFDVVPNGMNAAIDTDGVTNNFVLPESDLDADDVANYLDPDSDGDTLVDGVEGLAGYLNLDSDNDGISDLLEGASGIDNDNDGLDDITVLVDTDDDGLPNTQDVDSDGDWIPDAVEVDTSVAIEFIDTDNNNIPNYLDTDSDGDGISDADESGASAADEDVDGIVDYFDADNPIGANFVDVNNDGVNDDARPRNSDENHPTNADSIPDYLDTDSDGDGILDATETKDDFDNDDVPNYLDLDSDGDGLSDEFEGELDSAQDSDLDPNYLDLDSDGDGLEDARESLEDADGDDVIGLYDRDSNNNGVLDGNEPDPLGDNDGDGILNRDDQSIDEDNDGIPDIYESVEWQESGAAGTHFAFLKDSDKDGIPDAVEAGLSGVDSNNNGLDDMFEFAIVGGSDEDQNGFVDDVTLANSDDDEFVDYIDTDSDNDKIPDAIESGMSVADDDNDGISDSFDIDFVGGVDVNGDGVSDLITLPDTDGDGINNTLDVDSDNDGISDQHEGMTNLDDLNANEVIDYFDAALIADHNNSEGKPVDVDDNVIDVNGDGFVDAKAFVDTDLDGVADIYDLDSDNDGLMDVNEAGPGIDDMNYDGFADDGQVTTSPVDTDEDTVADYRDLDSDNDGIFDMPSEFVEFDQNNDGQVDLPATDTDGDGVPDVTDSNPIGFGTNGDVDGDGVPNALDEDDDGDGINDVLEGEGDFDGDGIANHQDSDSDNDGISDANENDTELDVLIDSDGDGIPNIFDYDSDNDGITDARENFGFDVDADANGVVDIIIDSNNDGLADNLSNNLLDTDGDGEPNYLDLDSDNDGFSDQAESSAPGFPGDNNNAISSDPGLQAGVGQAAAVNVLWLLLLLPLGFRRKQQ